ncbi:MAG: DNA-binding protein WhiA [Clostridia bacterium]|nr:DNA-binding protein WhiA [Clostridia bacterium]
MNFAKEIKQELLSKNIKDKCCKRAFLAGVIRGTGNLFLQDGEYGLEFKLDSEDGANRITEYLSSLYGFEMREVGYTLNNRYGKEIITLNIHGQGSTKILVDLGVLIENGNEYAVSLKLFDKVCEKECCIRSFLKGLFVAVGNCILPSAKSAQTTGYHSEFVFYHYTTALEVAKKLEDAGVKSKITRRKGTFIVYIKSGEEIKNLVAFLGCPVSVLKITDLMINREIKNNSNRQKNCDLGNLNKQVEASAKQISAIEKLKSLGEFDKLKKDLKEVAIARLEYQDDTLTELAERLNLSKSCLNHRLRKIVHLASEL